MALLVLPLSYIWVVVATVVGTAVDGTVAVVLFVIAYVATAVFAVVSAVVIAFAVPQPHQRCIHDVIVFLTIFLIRQQCVILLL